MKKLLMLFIAVAAVAVLHAQSREQTRNVILGGNNGSYGANRDVVLGGNNNRYPVYQDNRYDNNRQRRYSKWERDRAMRQQAYERQRRAEKHRRFDNDDFYEKRNNGKHKGWYKGKGNPHKFRF